MLVFQDWLNANEQRAYPIHDDATRTDISDRLLPNDFLVDASISLPRSAGQFVYLSSAAVTENLVTLTLLASEVPPSWSASSSSSSGTAAFVPIGVVSLTKPVTRYKNYAITPLYPGVGGWVAFGGRIESDNVMMLLFNSMDATGLIGRVIHVFNDLPVLSLGKVAAAAKLTGIVKLQGVAGITKTAKGTRLINGQTVSVALLGLDYQSNRTTQMQDLAGPCGKRPQSYTCDNKPIIDINGVVPDCEGNIDVEFVGETVVGDVTDGMVIDFPVGLSKACPKSNKLWLDTRDVCVPISSSSSSSSSSSTSFSSSSSTRFGGYCEDFAAGFGEMSDVVGLFSIVTGSPPGYTNRAKSSAGYSGEQFMINPYRRLNLVYINDSHLIDVTIRPRAANGEGHIVFGYYNPVTLFFAGLTLKPTTAFPGGENGFFFFGQRLTGVSPPPLAWPDTLGYGYNFFGITSVMGDARFAAPVKLSLTDYRVTLEISRCAYLAQERVAARMDVSWLDAIAGPQYVSHTIFPLSLFTYPMDGLAGFGVVDSETEFDNFGLDCTGSSSWGCP